MGNTNQLTIKKQGIRYFFSIMFYKKAILYNNI